MGDAGKGAINHTGCQGVVTHTHTDDAHRCTQDTDTQTHRQTHTHTHTDNPVDCRQSTGVHAGVLSVTRRQDGQGDSCWTRLLLDELGPCN